MGKLLTELNRTGHDCFGFRPVPWMCNLKYAEDGSSTIIPYRYKEAVGPSRDSTDTSGIIGNLDLNIQKEQKTQQLLEEKERTRKIRRRQRNTPRRNPIAHALPVPSENPLGNLPPFPAPREKVKPVITPPIPDKIDLEDPLDTKPVVGPKGPIQPQPTSPIMDPLQARRTLEGIQNAKIPEAPAPAAPPAAPATSPTTHGPMTPTKLPPSQRQVSQLGFTPKMTASGLQFVGPSEDGAAQKVYSAEEFEQRFGADYANQKIIENQKCDNTTYWGKLNATQDVGFDQNGKLVTYVKVPGADGQIKVHPADSTGHLIKPLGTEDGLLPWSPEEISSGLVVRGWQKGPRGLYVNKFSGEVLSQEQYMRMAQSESSIKLNQVQDNFRATIPVTEQMRDQGVYSGIYLTPVMDDKTGTVRYVAYSTLLKDEKGHPRQIPLGKDYRHPLNLWMKDTEMSSDFGGQPIQDVANRFYDPTDPNNSSTIPVMTDSPLFQSLLSEHPELAAVPTSFSVDEHGRVECYYTDEKGNTLHTRLPDSAAALVPAGARDYGYRPASQEECEKYGVPSGTLLHMTQDKFGQVRIEAMDSSGMKYGAVSDSRYEDEINDLSRKYYTDPTAPQDDNSDTNNKWSQVLKYVMLGLPIGLALGLVGWGATGGKGNLGAALLGGAGLGATLGGLGAYSGLLGGGTQYADDDDDYYYGSAMNAGY